MPFYEVHLHKTEDLVGRMVIKADTQQEARSMALEAAEKDHDDVIDYSMWEDEWVQLGEISAPDEPEFNFGAAYWDTNLNKWTTTKPHIFANEEGKPVGNPIRLGRSVEWAPYEDVGDWALPSGPSHRAEDKKWTPPKIPYNINDDVDAYDLQECPWCGGDMEHDGGHDGWWAHCGTCEGAIELRTITENIIVDIEPPTEKWTTDLADFSAQMGEARTRCPVCEKGELWHTYGVKCTNPECDFMEPTGWVGEAESDSLAELTDIRMRLQAIEDLDEEELTDEVMANYLNLESRLFDLTGTFGAESFEANIFTDMMPNMEKKCDLCPWLGDLEDFNYHIAYDCPGTISHRAMLVNAYESNFGAEEELTPKQLVEEF